MAWVPLESNPEVMTKFMHKLGVPKKWSVVDVYGLDPELLAMVPRPIAAIILLYPISPKTELYKSELEKKEKENGVSNNNVYHLAQYVSNACGTVALIHSIANRCDQIILAEGDLKAFLDETKDLSSEERGNKLVGAQAISNTHEELAQEGQTETPAEDDKVFHHFLAFIEKDGSIYELDGRKPFPINHGKSSPETFLEDAARVCQEYINKEPEDVRFTVMAIAATD